MGVRAAPGPWAQEPIRQAGRRAGTADGVVAADAVVVASGWAARDLAVPGIDLARAVRPLKGQILRLRGEPGLLSRTVRATVHGEQVYLVPRPDGELVVGATSEDVGPDTRVTAGAVHDLLRAAVCVVPEVSQLELSETTARLRPASMDNLPLVGPTGTRGLVLAVGHGRDGVLLTPLTTEVVVGCVLGTPLPDEATSLHPERFAADRSLA